MTNIYDQARALGLAVLESEAAQKLNAAREVFDNDPSAQKLVDEYADLKQKFNDIMADKDSDKMQLADIGNQITDLEKAFKENPVTKGLMEAETQYGAFINSVFNIISATIQGNDTADCTGVCSGCTGCN